MRKWETIATCESYTATHVLMNTLRRLRHCHKSTGPYRRYRDSDDDGRPLSTWSIQEFK